MNYFHLVHLLLNIVNTEHSDAYVLFQMHKHIKIPETFELLRFSTSNFASKRFMHIHSYFVEWDDFIEKSASSVQHETQTKLPFSLRQCMWLTMSMELVSARVHVANSTKKKLRKLN